MSNMKMTIDEIIDILYRKYDAITSCGYSTELSDAINEAIPLLKKYKKIQKILDSASYTENNTVYSYTYDEDSRVKHIREVVEDGTN